MNSTQHSFCPEFNRRHVLKCLLIRAKPLILLASLEDLAAAVIPVVRELIQGNPNRAEVSHRSREWSLVPTGEETSSRGMSRAERDSVAGICSGRACNEGECLAVAHIWEGEVVIS